MNCFILGTTSPNFSQTSPSWVYHSGSPSRLLHSTPSAQDEIIENEESLKQYLAEYDSFEKSSIVSKYNVVILTIDEIHIICLNYFLNN